MLAMTTASAQPLPKDPDVMWIPRKDALYKLAQADSATIHKIKIAQLEQDLADFRSVVAELKQAVSKAERADSLGQVNLRLAEANVLQYERLIAAEKTLAAKWEKAFIKERRKRRWIQAGGIAVTAALVASIIIK